MKCLMDKSREVSYPCSRACPLFGDCMVAFGKEPHSKMEAAAVSSPKTNGDRYRAMSDEEMAEALSEVDVCPPRADRTLCGDREGCKRCWLDYLRSPADKETNDDDKELEAISAILESGKCPFPEKVCPKHYLCSRCIEEALKNTAAERRVSEDGEESSLLSV